MQLIFFYIQFLFYIFYLKSDYFNYIQSTKKNIKKMQSQTPQQQQRINRILTTILTQNDRRIYNLIKQHGCTKNDIKKRTSYPSNMIDKILKDLASYNLIKSIKKPESKNLNVWVLYNTTEQQDYEQKKQQNQDLMALIRKKQGPISLNQLKKDAIRKAIKIDLFDQVIQVLKLRGQVFVSEGNNNDQKILRKRNLEKIMSPCIECHLNDICKPDGVVNPSICPYLFNW